MRAGRDEADAGAVQLLRRGDPAIGAHQEALAVVEIRRGEVQPERRVAHEGPGGGAGQHLDLAGHHGGEAVLPGQVLPDQLLRDRPASRRRWRGRHRHPCPAIRRGCPARSRPGRRSRCRRTARRAPAPRPKRRAGRRHSLRRGAARQQQAERRDQWSQHRFSPFRAGGRPSCSAASAAERPGGDGQPQQVRDAVPEGRRRPRPASASAQHRPDRPQQVAGIGGTQRGQRRHLDGGRHDDRAEPAAQHDPRIVEEGEAHGEAGDAQPRRMDAGHQRRGAGDRRRREGRRCHGRRGIRQHREVEDEQMRRQHQVLRRDAERHAAPGRGSAARRWRRR